MLPYVKAKRLSRTPLLPLQLLLVSYPRCIPTARFARACSVSTLVALGAAPVLFIAIRVALNLRNIAYWDEFDSVLDYLVKINSGDTWLDWLQRLFAVHNEHRMVTSRLLFSLGYTLTGSINFAVLGAIGDSFLVLLCAVLVAQTKNSAMRWRLALVLALGMFHLQHHENLFWSGSSIDHFLAPLLAACAFAALLRGTRMTFLGALLFGFLASFTLAHGLLVWPIGAAMLMMQRQWLLLGVWSMMASLTATGFFTGFTVNPQHHVEAARAFGQVISYWLTLIGTSPAQGDLVAAPWLGIVFLALLGWMATDRPWRSQPLAIALIAFCLLSLGLIALGRVGVSAGQPVPSRYYILSSLSWSLAAWHFIERFLARGARTTRVLAVAFSVLGVFNVTANARFIGLGQKFADQREQALMRFEFYDTLNGAQFQLYPRPERADTILRAAVARGIYRPALPPRPVRVARPREITNVSCYLDDARTNPHGIYINGWAYAADQPVRRGELMVVFWTETFFRAYPAVTVRRPDVAQAIHRADLLFSGFRLHLPVGELPPGVYNVGVLFRRGYSGDYYITDYQVTAPPPLGPTRPPPPMASR